MTDDTNIAYPIPETFAEQIEEARNRLNLPADASAWQVMCANAAAETATKDFLRGLFGL